MLGVRLAIDTAIVYTLYVLHGMLSAGSQHALSENLPLCLWGLYVCSGQTVCAAPRAHEPLGAARSLRTATHTDARRAG